MRAGDIEHATVGRVLTMTAAKAGNGENPNGKGPARAARATRSERKDDLPGIWVGYGKLVKLFRTRARMSREQLAELVGYSVDQVASVEQGRRPAKIAFTEAAETALNAMGTLAVLQDEVDLAKLPMFFQDFAQIENDAVSRFSFDPLLVPGLLQTEAYARAVFAGACPRLTPEQIEQSVEARLARQRLLTREPLASLSFIIGEAALVNPVGGKAVMTEQLQRLVELGKLRNVVIQVMPLRQGFHSGLNGPFVLLETKEHQHFAYIESQGIMRVVSDPQIVSGIALSYGELRSQALNVEESTRLLQSLAGER